ncbi:MAG: Coenzyme F420 hydrogenase/dehydrogenase, beta subunit C-terminal domain [Tissierellia bacterium]|nr:Coenzyme F420 hydrogenase/dehydrogenase, beta subunit C-terminal domain [Tissierellia bacterium]
MMVEPRKNIFEAVINQDLCIGCGACLYSASKSDLKMSWNQEGFLIPISDTKNSISEMSLKVCPFNPFPENEVKTENEIADIFLKDSPNRHQRVGNYYNTYVGYSHKYRLTSSSGGMATYLIDKLLDNNIVDAVIAVKEGENSFYEYSIVRLNNDLLSYSETKYYPVSLGTVMEYLKNSDERFAVVGVACFIKSVRLLQYYHPKLKERIIFTIGIICGGVKSRFFAEYLAGKSGVDSNQFSKPKFRIKDHSSTASDYSFGCNDANDELHTIKMSKVGDIWGSGMFKNNACDFCDDVTTELADISLGDAWLNPYNQDGKGTNVVVTRSQLAEDLIHKGITNNELSIEYLPFDEFLSSQQGSFNHRHKGLKYRIKNVSQEGVIIPPKRHGNERISLDFKLVQKQRRVVRKLSLIEWIRLSNSDKFDDSMSVSRETLMKRTKIYHYGRAIKRKLKL